MVKLLVLYQRTAVVLCSQKLIVELEGEEDKRHSHHDTIHLVSRTFFVARRDGYTLSTKVTSITEEYSLDVDSVFHLWKKVSSVVWSVVSSLPFVCVTITSLTIQVYHLLFPMDLRDFFMILPCMIPIRLSLIQTFLLDQSICILRQKACVK